MPTLLPRIDLGGLDDALTLCSLVRRRSLGTKSHTWKLLLRLSSVPKDHTAAFQVKLFNPGLLGMALLFSKCVCCAYSCQKAAVLNVEGSIYGCRDPGSGDFSSPSSWPLTSLWRVNQPRRQRVL